MVRVGRKPARFSTAIAAPVVAQKRKRSGHQRRPGFDGCVGCASELGAWAATNGRRAPDREVRTAAPVPGDAAAGKAAGRRASSRGAGTAAPPAYHLPCNGSTAAGPLTAPLAVANPPRSAAASGMSGAIGVVSGARGTSVAVPGGSGAGMEGASIGGAVAGAAGAVTAPSAPAAAL